MGTRARRLSVSGLVALFLVYLAATLVPVGEGTVATLLGEWLACGAPTEAGTD